MTLDQRVGAWLDRRAAGRIVVAVSGGADSSALFLALARGLSSRGERAATALVAAHFNHRLRDQTEHERDLAGVRALAARLAVPLMTGSVRAGELHRQASAAGGIEAAARQARYSFLGGAARVTGARYVCTGHTRDDQAETILMRLLAGVDGVLLSGIPESRGLTARGELYRPLLTIARSEIDSYLQAHGVSPSADATNASTAYRRNFVRREVIPAIETEWPALRQDLVSLGESMARYHLQVKKRAASLGVEYGRFGARMPRRAFFALDADARLEALYAVMRRLGLLERRNRPGHAFFAPALRDDPGGSRTLLAGRKTRITLQGQWLVIRGE